MPVFTQEITRNETPYGNRIICHIPQVGLAYNGRSLNIAAIIDTGASKTQVGQGVIDFFRIPPVVNENLDPELVIIANQIVPVTNYPEIEIVIPGLPPLMQSVQSLGVYFVRDLGTRHGLIIGLDLITRGIFKLDADRFSFELPD